MSLKVVLLTALALVCFASNSVLSRLALIDPGNDAISFANLRLLAGAVALGGLLLRKPVGVRPSWVFRLAGPVALFAYAIFFSLAYIHLSSGTGALIAFGSVQVTMIAASILGGQRLSLREQLGFGLALGGMVILVLPSLGTPDLGAAILMSLAGFSFGIYNLLGQRAKEPVRQTARNFVLTVPLVVVLGLLHPFQLNHQGWILAIVSGAVTSGLGYVIWYMALAHLKTSTAAILQLAVPALSAFGGVIFLHETIQTRLVVATALIFGGITLKVFSFKSGLRK